MRFVILLLLHLFLATQLLAQCDAEPTLTAQTKILATKAFSHKQNSEISLAFSASVTETSWLTKGSEAATVTVFVDGKYNQDVILFAGEKAGKSAYKVFLGEFQNGKHKIDIVLNDKFSSKKFGKLDIANIKPEFSNVGHLTTEIVARRNAPFIYARPNSIDKFSDIPLVVYYEIFDEPEGVSRIIYSVIFSHEDGGTKGKALMARWGRMTDIEWIYEIKIDQKGNKISEVYQGANHETKAFQGKRSFGSHPLIYNVTDNNNFADTGCSPLRFAPAAVWADLSNGSRETLMEKFPWTYRIMSEEIIREGRVGNDPADADKIFDPLDYLYVEVYAEQKNTAVSVELDTADGKTSSSDLGIPQLRVARNGYFRIAIQNPSKDFPSSVRIRCHAAGTSTIGNCENVKLIKVVRLDKDFAPVTKFYDPEARSIKPGESAVFFSPSGPAAKTQPLEKQKAGQIP